MLQIVDTGKESVALSESEIELLRSGYNMQNVEPFYKPMVGTKVRITAGVMLGVEGTLVRKSESRRFVLTVTLVNQHAAMQVNAEYLELMTD